MGQDARLARSDAFFRLGIFVPLEFAVLWMGVAASGEAGGIRVLGLRPAWYAVFTSVLAAFLLVDFVMRRPVLQVRTPSRHALVEVGAGGITGLVIGELLWDRFDLGVISSAVFCAWFALYILRDVRGLLGESA